MKRVLATVQQPFDFGKQRGNPVRIPLVNLPGQGKKLVEVTPAADRKYPYAGWHTSALYHITLAPSRKRV